MNKTELLEDLRLEIINLSDDRKHRINLINFIEDKYQFEDECNTEKLMSYLYNNVKDVNILRSGEIINNIPSHIIILPIK